MAQIDISPRVLRMDLAKTLKEVDAQIAEVKAEAERMGTEPHKLRNRDGWVMIPLLAAKAQCLVGIVQLQGK